jgi:nucleoside phosphorylase/tetratricopeptide (TPR) repeat protein
MSAPTSPLWMVPRRRDPNFVGREEELAALEAALAATGSSALTQPAAVHGQGGVGKTLLAVEFAYRHADDYAAVLWLHAEEPTALAAAFADLARTLGLPEADEPDQAVRTAAVLRWLESPQSGRWLLVFDNAERRQDIEPHVPRRHTGHVLITSRNPDLAPLARPVKVRKLPRAPSIELLHKGLEGGDEAEADRLADALGDLPLALAQAAAFVRETGCTFADYQERFQKQGEAFDREQGAEPGYGRTVAVTLELALDRLRKGGSALSPAEELLARCAFYAPERIPRELLAEELPNESTLDSAIRTLRGYALAETDAGTITVHRLIQRTVKGRLFPEEQAEYAEHAVENLTARFPGEPEDVKTWPECRKWLDHALHAIKHSPARHVAHAADWELLNRIGIYFLVTYALPHARDYLLRALHLGESAYGPDHPQVAVTLSNLGLVAREQGNLPEARGLLERALRLHQLAHDPDPPALARTLNNLGLVARDQGNLAEARHLQTQALRLKEATYGRNHPQVAVTLNNLGRVARELGNLVTAQRLLKRALRIKEAAHGPDHPDVAQTMDNLGLVAFDRGDLAEAQRLHERALQIKEAAYGPDHPEMAPTLVNLGLVFARTDRLDQAATRVRRALDIFQRAFGDQHPLTVGAREHLRRIEGQIQGIIVMSESIAGNEAVFTELRNELKKGDPIAFVGAGASGGLYPLWNGLIEQLADRAVAQGLATKEAHDFWVSSAATTPDHVVEQVRQALGRGEFNKAIYDIFRAKAGADGNKFTPAHRALLRMNCCGYTTTNYDPGLIYARSAEVPGATADHDAVWNQDDAVRRWYQGEVFQPGERPILFAHGRFNDGDSIVLGVEEYRKAYNDSPLYRNLFEALLGQRRLVFVGFGFSDPWLNFLADKVTAEVRGAARHYAIIGLEKGEAIPQRRTLFRDKYGAKVIFYPITRRPDGRPDHGALLPLLEQLADPRSSQDVSGSRAARLPSEGALSGAVKPPERQGDSPTTVGLVGVEERTPAPTVGIVTALPCETAAVRAVFGDPSRIDMPGSGAGRAYWMAEVASPRGGTHRVLIAQADMGTNSAAVRASLLLAHFPTVESIVMCGIAGGIPDSPGTADGVRLGDIVVSNQKGVVQYDFVKRTTKKKGAKVVEEVRPSPRPPSALLLEAVRLLASDAHLGRYPWEARLQEGLAWLKWQRPDATTDSLAPAGPPTQTAPPADEQRRPGQPRIFLAPIASANMLLKDAAKRDALRSQFGARAVEMEGSGIADATWNQGVGYLVVRGICDYCDTGKNDLWQKYAALAAAAYVRALLESMPGTAGRPQ